MRNALVLSISFLALALTGCLDEAQALGLVKNVPKHERVVLDPPRSPAMDLCCYDSLCVQPRIEQDVCDTGTVAVSCASVRLAEVGPLWSCL